MSSLDRLIALSKRTGDRLIIHNPYDDGDNDIVVMPLNAYTRLIDDYAGFGEDDDIPMEEDWRDPDVFSEGFGARSRMDDPFSPVAQDSWHPIGEVIEDEYPEIYTESATHCDPYSSFSRPEDPFSELPSRQEEPFDGFVPPIPEETQPEEKKEEETLLPIPLAEGPLEENFFGEESLEEDPIFLEEPV